MPGLVSPFSREQAATFGAANLRFRHGLDRSPLFGDERLIDLIERTPRDRYHVNTPGLETASRAEWREGGMDGVSGEKVLAAVTRGALWVHLQRVGETDSAYADLLDALFTDIEAQVPGLSTYKRTMSILISSPNLKVAYHCDVPGQMLWQVRGRKTLHVYPARAPFLPQESLENIILRKSADTELNFDPSFERDAGVLRIASRRCDALAAERTASGRQRRLRQRLLHDRALDKRSARAIRRRLRQRAAASRVRHRRSLPSAARPRLGRKTRARRHAQIRHKPGQEAAGLRGGLPCRSKRSGRRSRRSGQHHQPLAQLASPRRRGCRVDILRNVADVEAIADDWRALEVLTPEATGFQSADWCLAWMAARATCRLLAHRGRPRCRATRLHRSAGNQSVRRRARLHWLGEPWTQYGDAIVADDARRFQWLAAAWREIAAWRDVDVIKLARMRADAALALLPGFAGRTIIATDAAPFVDLGAPSPKPDKRLRARRRRLEAMGPLRFDVVTDASDRHDSVRLAIALKQRWLAQRGLRSSGLSHPALPKLMDDLAESQSLVIGRLRVGDATAALELGLVVNGGFRSLLGAHDT